MLKQNGRSVFGQLAGTFAGAHRNQTGSYLKGGLRNRFVGAFDQKFGAYPNGHLAPNAFILPNKPGSISSYTIARESISGSAALTPAFPADGSAALTMTATNAQLDQIVSAIASAAMAISANNAALAAAAGITASGTCAISVASAICGAIFSVTASSSMAIDPDAILTALAHMQAEAGGPTDLSPEGLANAVWNAVLADYTTVGTAGYALSNATGGGSGGATVGDLETIRDEILVEVRKRLKTSTFIALK